MHKRTKIVSHALILIAWCFLLAAQTAWAQLPIVSTLPDTVPPRGFYPGGSYSLSDIETIDNVTGNMILHFPIAKLPPGRGGSSFAFNLVYNSTIYDTQNLMVDVSTQTGVPGSPAMSEQNYRESPFGGWRYAFSYILGWDDMNMNGIPCNGGSSSFEFMPFIIMPDGSKRTLRMEGSTYGYVDYQGQGRYPTSPFGAQAGCNGLSQYNPVVTVAPKLVYVTDDGSYIRVEVVPAQETWTIFLPDGAQVFGNYLSTQWTSGGMGYTMSPPPPASGPTPTYYEQIMDRNSNVITIQNSCNYDIWNSQPDCTTTATDDLGREILYDYGDGINETVQWPGNGTTLTTSVTYGTIPMKLFQYFCIGDRSLYDGGDACSTINVHGVESITLPPAQTRRLPGTPLKVSDSRPS
jgi:hypothetical protein